MDRDSARNRSSERRGSDGVHVPAIATIVGLHLFPLARAFRYPMHYVTGTLLVLWSAASVFILPRENVASMGALGTSAILLLSAAYTLTNTALAARRVSDAVTGAPSASS